MADTRRSRAPPTPPLRLTRTSAAAPSIREAGHTRTVTAARPSHPALDSTLLATDTVSRAPGGQRGAAAAPNAVVGLGRQAHVVQTRPVARSVAPTASQAGRPPRPLRRRRRMLQLPPTQLLLVHRLQLARQLWAHPGNRRARRLRPLRARTARDHSGRRVTLLAAEGAGSIRKLASSPTRTTRARTREPALPRRAGPKLPH